MESINVCLQSEICRVFGLKELRSYQVEVFYNLICKKQDCFVSHSTGSGKSLCFQAWPLLQFLFKNFDASENLSVGSVTKNFFDNDDHAIIVISPLTSLMDNQMNFLNKNGIKAGVLRGCDDVGSGESTSENLSAFEVRSLKYFASTILVRKIEKM